MTTKQTNYKSISGISINNYQKNDKFKKYRELWEVCSKNGIVTDFPLNVDLEVTNACNLRCPHCARAHNNWGNGSIGYASEKLVKKVINETSSENGYCMKFSLRGEPLLHPKILTFLKWAKDSNLLDYYFNTNGTLLNKKLATDFVRLQIPRISISVGGWNAKTFSQCQVGTNIHTVMKNVKYGRYPVK